MHSVIGSSLHPLAPSYDNCSPVGASMPRYPLTRLNLRIVASNVHVLDVNWQQYMVFVACLALSTHGTTRCLIDHMYQYSLDSFVTFFIKSISKAKPSDTVDGRVLNLRDALRMTIFTWVSRGLFERHKLIFLSQLAFNLMKRGTLGEDSMINELHFQFLLRGPRKQVRGAVACSLCFQLYNKCTTASYGPFCLSISTWKQTAATGSCGR